MVRVLLYASVLLATYLTGADTSVRARLLAAAADTRALDKKALTETNRSSFADALKGFGAEESIPAHRFPRMADVVAYNRVRPWTWRYDCRFHNDTTKIVTNTPLWPNRDGADDFRRLINDDNPDVRSLAIEALAACLEPEDVPRIAAYLNDDAPAVAALRWNRNMSSVAEFFDTGETNPIIRWKEWQTRRVRDYAEVALRLMTGQRLTAENFASWWTTNNNPRTRVWYWQERLHCELGEVEATGESLPWPLSDDAREALWEKRQREQAKRNAAVIKRVEQELRRQTPEVEAKVKLLAVNNYSSGLGMELDAPLLGPFTATRLTRERLFELLARKNLWPDVDWGRWGEGNDSVWIGVTARICSSADEFFRREDIPRLRSLAKYPAVRRALALGTSRMLPPASAKNLDDENTADGVLRTTFRADPDKYWRRDLIAELARIGWERNKAFLEEQFFADATRDDYAVREAIIEALTKPPSRAKRDFLGHLLLSDRYELLWKRTAEHPGSDIDTGLAGRAALAYGTREQADIVTSALGNRETPPAQIARARQTLEAIFAKRR